MDSVVKSMSYLIENKALIVVLANESLIRALDSGHLDLNSSSLESIPNCSDGEIVDELIVVFMISF
jgi:hypothetical protein